MNSSKHLSHTAWALLAVLLAISPPLQSQDKISTHAFSELSTNAGHLADFEVTLSLNSGYDLPRVQMSFQLSVHNSTGHQVEITNPLKFLNMAVSKPDREPVDLPERLSEFTVDSLDRGFKWPLPSPITFKKSIVNGKEDPVAHDHFQISSNSSIVFVFEFEEVVGERILAAAKVSNDKFVVLTAFMAIISQDAAVRTMMRLREMPLPIPRPSSEKR